MKLKKYLSTVLAIILIIFVLTGCGLNRIMPKPVPRDAQAAQESYDASLAGKYILVSWEDKNGDYLSYLIYNGIRPENVYLELRSDGTYIWDLSALEMGIDKGTYKVTDGVTLTLAYDGGEDVLTIADGRLYLKEESDILVFEKTGNVPSAKTAAYEELAGKYILESWNYRFEYWDYTDEMLRFGTDPADSYIELRSDRTFVGDVPQNTVIRDGTYRVDGDTVFLTKYYNGLPNGEEIEVILGKDKLIMEDTRLGTNSLGYTIVFVKEGVKGTASLPAPALPYSNSYFGSPHGSAKLLEGRILLVSIVLSTSISDFSKYYSTFVTPPGYLDLRQAKRMIEGEAGNYGKTVEVIFDVSPGSDLVYEAKIDYEIYKFNRTGKNESILISSIYDINDYIENNIPYLELADKYQTDNIAYLVFVNEVGISYALPFTSSKDLLGNVLSPEDFYHEKTVIYNPVAGGSLVFHEILHLFGVPDYYREGADEIYGVSEEMVEYVYKTYPQEVMTNSDAGEQSNPYDDTPPRCKISPLTAYRLGWLDDIPELKQFPNFRNPGNVPGLKAPYWYEP